MEGVTDIAFRQVVAKAARPDIFFTEFTNVNSYSSEKGRPNALERLKYEPQEQPIVAQIWGKNPEMFAETAKAVKELGYQALDINMGCSAPDVYKTGAGIGWMLRPVEETREMICEVGKVLASYNQNYPENKKRFSVKLRLGDENFTDEGFYSFCDMLVDAGVELLTLHPRTKKEKLSRPPRYSYCQALCERYKGAGVKIYLNGNIKDKASAEYALAACPDISGIMISRASVQKPWIFYQINSEKSKEIKVDMEKICYDYIKNVEEYQPAEFYKTRLQRFFTYFCMNFQFAHYAQTRFVNAAEKGNDVLREEIRDFFEKCPEEKIKIYK
jgi:tRNA-dihydrouridine synthase